MDEPQVKRSGFCHDVVKYCAQSWQIAIFTYERGFMMLVVVNLIKRVKVASHKHLIKIAECKCFHIFSSLHHMQKFIHVQLSRKIFEYPCIFSKCRACYIPLHRGGGSKYVFGPPTLTKDFFKKRPAADEKFLGSLFSKI